MGTKYALVKVSPKYLLYFGLFLLVVNSFLLGNMTSDAVTVRSIENFQDRNQETPSNLNNVSNLKTLSTQNQPPQQVASYPDSSTTHKSLRKTVLSDVSLTFNIQTTAFRIFGDYIKFRMTPLQFLLSVFSFAGFLFGLALIEKYRVEIYSQKNR